MTFRDFGKFLSAVVNRGVGANGKRIVGEQLWKTFMLPSTNPGNTLRTHTNTRNTSKV